MKTIFSAAPAVDRAYVAAWPGGGLKEFAVVAGDQNSGGF